MVKSLQAQFSKEKWVHDVKKVLMSNTHWFFRKYKCVFLRTDQQVCQCSPIKVCIHSFCKVTIQGPIMVSSHFLYISTVMFSDRKALRSPFPIHLGTLTFLMPNFICANSRLLSLLPQHQHSRVYSQLRDSHFNGQIVYTL